VVNGRGAVGAGVAYLKLRELASTIKFHTIIRYFGYVLQPVVNNVG
jgi:hypothetical protein